MSVTRFLIHMACWAVVGLAVGHLLFWTFIIWMLNQ